MIWGVPQYRQHSSQETHGLTHREAQGFWCRWGPRPARKVLRQIFISSFRPENFCGCIIFAKVISSKGATVISIVPSSAPCMRWAQPAPSPHQNICVLIEVYGVYSWKVRLAERPIRCTIEGEPYTENITSNLTIARFQVLGHTIITGRTSYSLYNRRRAKSRSL